MKSIKLYNLIFPIWILLFIPPIIIGSLIGAVYLLLILLIFDKFNVVNATVAAMAGNPFNDVGGFLIVASAVIVAGLLIYFFNNRFTLRKHVVNDRVRVRIAILIGIITAPWTYFVPASLIGKFGI